MLKYWTILFICFCCCNLLAQSEAPQLECAERDAGNNILQWSLPTTDCGGAFNSYVIYGTQAPTSGYNIIATITDPAQTNYTHISPTAGTWFYYMETNRNCPDTRLQSDTLDTNPPVEPEMEGVAVWYHSGAVRIRWSPSISPEVYAYIVDWESPSGFIFLDTIFGRFNNEYTHFDASSDTKSERYRILALDRCGNASLVSENIHQTVLLNATTPSGCDRNIELTWNLYQNWKNPIEKHYIYVSENGSTPTIIDSVSGDATSYILSDLNDDTDYCFSISIKESNTNVFSSSNKVCRNINIVQPITDFYLINATVTDSGDVELTWSWNEDAEINNACLLNSTDNQEYFCSHLLSATNLDAINTTLDGDRGTSDQSIFYTVQATDDCDSVSLSNYGSTIHLSGAAVGGINQVVWTPFNFEHGKVIEYRLYHIENGIDVFLETLPDSVTSFEEMIDPNQVNQSKIYYRVVAVAQMTFPNGDEYMIESQSNIACIEQIATIYCPNAFAPEGENFSFKPSITFADNIDYSMMIYNRWGSKIFETADVRQGWDGTHNSQPLAMGVYVYLIHITQPNGEIIQKQGTVMLVR